MSKLHELEAKLKNIGLKKREALDHGDGWHDNAQWDAVVMEERILVAQIRELKKELVELR